MDSPDASPIQKTDAEDLLNSPCRQSASSFLACVPQQAMSTPLSSKGAFTTTTQTPGSLFNGDATPQEDFSPSGFLNSPMFPNQRISTISWDENALDTPRIFSSGIDLLHGACTGLTPPSSAEHDRNPNTSPCVGNEGLGFLADAAEKLTSPSPSKLDFNSRNGSFVFCRENLDDWKYNWRSPLPLLANAKKKARVKKNIMSILIDVSASKTDDVPASKTDDVPASKTGVVPASKTDVVPASKTDVVSASKTDVAPASKTDVAPASKTGVVSASKTDVVSASKTDVVHDVWI